MFYEEVTQLYTKGIDLQVLNSFENSKCFYLKNLIVKIALNYI